MKRKTAILHLILLFPILFGFQSDKKDALKYWPSWRGPKSDGVSPLGKPPIEWNETKNIK